MGRIEVDQQMLSDLNWHEDHLCETVKRTVDAIRVATQNN